MKRLIYLMLLLAFLACSEEDVNSDVCCDTTVSKIIASYNETYQNLLSNEDLTEQQRKELEQEHEERLNNPCESYKRYTLESAGASCDSSV